MKRLSLRSLGLPSVPSSSSSVSTAFFTQLSSSFHSIIGKHDRVCNSKDRTARMASIECGGKATRKLFSSDAGSSQLDTEKDLFRLRREMTSHYTSGNYPDALKCAQTIETTAEQLYGKKSTIYASSLNNTALMLKMMGEHQEAVDKYSNALHVYEDLVGPKHENYCSVLSNIGITYKLLAQEAPNETRRNDYLRHAETATVDAYALRVELKGENSKEVYDSQITYASILRMKGKVEDAEFQLKATLSSCKKQFDKRDTDSLITATVMNNLGHLLKQQQKYEEALPLYEEALSLRRAFLKDKHPEIIVSKHNLAELLMVMDRGEDARKLQEEIVADTNLDGVYGEDGKLRTTTPTENTAK